MINTVNLTNFKCFEHLCVEGLKRVNLIGGKNNIGKTSFLEGLEILLKPKSAFGLRIVTSDIIRRRQVKKNINPHQSQQLQEFELDFFNELKKNIIIKSDKLDIILKYISVGEIIEANNIQSFNPQIMQMLSPNTQKFAPIPFLEFSYLEDKLASSIQDIINPNFIIQDLNHMSNKVNFISSCTTEERQIAVYYGNLIELSKEQYLNDSLNIFDKNITALKQIATEKDVVLKLLLANRKAPILLSSLGEGTNRYIAILCAIWASQDGYLFIDEIENGIHYTNYPKLWTVIFEASKMANCQIFITTHSKECIEAFNEVNSNNEGEYFEFYRNQKKNKIAVMKRDHEQLSYSLTHGGEVRGE